MTRWDWNRVSELFGEAAGLSGAERDAFLVRHCADDPGLRAELESLLGYDGDEGDFVGVVGEAASQLHAGPVERPETVGPYRVLRRLGSGGAGSVWLAARDDDEYRKEVAVKLLHAATGPGGHARFLAERQILATLDHPNIARLIDGGTAPAGVPYVVMEHVDGQPIDEYCRERRLGLRQRIELFRVVCDAVQYAHRNLVVHRDLKPGNILVTSDGVPKLLDFGIAKLIEPGAEASPTATAERMLTPGYASPEQVLGRPITTASDVYSLGVLLYELLADESPYEGGTTDPLQLAQAIGHEQPRRPSTRPGAGDPQRAKQLRGDLDNIVLMALRKEPERRYASVEELSKDLGRHLRRIPVRARPATLRYRVQRFVSRNRWPVAAATVAVAALLAATFVSLAMLQRAVRARGAAEAETRRATLTGAQAALYADEALEARRLLETISAEERAWEWAMLEGELDEAAAVVNVPGAVAVAAGPRPAEFFTVSEGGMVECRDPFLGTVAWSADLGLHGIRRAAFSRAGDRLAVAAGREVAHYALPEEPGAPQPVRLWGVALEAPAIDLALSGDGSTLAAIAAAEVIVHDARGGAVHRWKPGVEPTAVAVSGDGDRVAVVTGEGEGHYRLYDLAGRRINSASGAGIDGVRLSHDGATVIALEGVEVRLREGATARVLHRMYGHRARVADADFLSGERRLVSAGEDQVLLVWDLERKSPFRSLVGHAAPIRQVTSSGDGRRVATLDSAGVARLWEVDREPAKFDVGGLWFGFSPDGSWLASGSDVGAVHLFDTAGHLPFDFLFSDTEGMTAMALSGNGRWLATVHQERIVLRELPDVAVRTVEEAGAPVGLLAFDPMGDTLFAAASSGSLVAWNVADGTERYRRNTEAPLALAAGPRGLLATSHDSGVAVRDAGGETLREVCEGSAPARALAFDPSGSRLACGGPDGAIRLVRPSTGAGMATLQGDAAEVVSLAFSPDGEQLAAGAVDGTIDLWDWRAERLLLRLRGSPDSIGSLAWSPRGDALVGGGRLWDTTAIHQRRTRLEQLDAAARVLRPRLEELLANDPDPESVAAALRADGSLDELHRRGALRAVMLSPPLPILPAGATAHLGTALEIDGIDGHVRIDDPEPLRLTPTFTVEAWIRRAGADSSPNLRTVINKEGEYQLAVDSEGRVFWTLGTPRGWTAWTGLRQPVPVGEWAHVALVRDGSTVRGYLNGRLVQTRTVPEAIGDQHPDMNELRIGGRQHTPSSFPGRIDEVRIWSVARTSEQIRAAMSRHVTGDEPGLLAAWSFEGTGPLVADDAHGRHPGHLTGAHRVSAR